MVHESSVNEACLDRSNPRSAFGKNGSEQRHRLNHTTKRIMMNAGVKQYGNAYFTVNRGKRKHSDTRHCCPAPTLVQWPAGNMGRFEAQYGPF